MNKRYCRIIVLLSVLGVGVLYPQEYTKKFIGHNEPVKAVVFLDEHTVISGSWDRTLRFWNIDTGKTVSTLKYMIKKQFDYEAGINCLALSPDKKTIVAGMFARLVFWNIETGKKVKEIDAGKLISDPNNMLSFLPRRVDTISFSPDGRYIVSGEESSLCLYSYEYGIKLGEFSSNMGYINSAFFLPDSKRILSGSGDGTIRLWDAITGKETKKLVDAHEREVSIALPYAENSIIYSQGNDIYLLDTTNNKKTQTFTGQTSLVIQLVLSHDKKIIASGSYDNTIRLWDVGTAKKLKEFKVTYPITSVAFSPNGKYIITGSQTGKLYLWTVN